MGPKTKGGEEKGTLGWGGKEPGGGEGAREGAFADGGERRELMSTGAIRSTYSRERCGKVHSTAEAGMS